MLSLVKLIELQKANNSKISQALISEHLLQFLNQTILGVLYGIENENFQNTYNQFNISLNLSKKNTLIFDLDETLVTSKISEEKATHNFSLIVDEQIQEFKFAIRPFAKEMLQILSEYYEIIIFTASHIDYAKKVLTFLDPSGSIVKVILDRNYCYQTPHGVLIKDLKAFKDIDLTSTLIIDNSSLSYCFSPKNGLPIITWEGDENDQELKALTEYLKQLQEGEEDLLSKHSKQFSIKTLFNFFNNISQ